MSSVRNQEIFKIVEKISEHDNTNLNNRYIRKALLHLIFGSRDNRGASMLLDLRDHRPPSLSLMDAVAAMHVGGGPVPGQPYNLELLAASPSAVALDTAAFNLRGLTAAEK